MKRLVMASAIVATLGSTVGYADQPVQFKQSQAGQVSFDIPAQGVGDALNAFAAQSGLQVVFYTKLGKGIQTKPLSGSFSSEEALKQLLSDTGLMYEYLNERTVAVQLAGGKGGKSKPASDNSLVAQGGTLAEKGNGEGAEHNNDFVIEEIIITASKRGLGTSLQDTAMAISALGRDVIDKRGLVSMGDYLHSLPGVSFQDRGAGQNQLIIRGLSADPQLDDSTVGVYFGETPVTGLGAPNDFGGAGNADIKLVDIERIEVIRGPQGTLYGSGSMGGTVRVIPVSPDLEAFEGKIATRYSHTGEIGGDNTMVQGVINAPLIIDSLAARLVAYQFNNSGYIENVAASRPDLVAAGLAQGGVAKNRGDVGSDEYTGFRLTTLWQPTDELGVTLAYLHQEIDQDGNSEVNLDLPGDFQQVRLNTGFQGSRYESLSNNIDITNLVINYDFGWGTLVSSSSWTNYGATVEADMSSYLGSPYYSHNSDNQEILVEELRLSSQFNSPFQFLVGLYYEDRERDYISPWPWSGSSNLDTDPFATAIRQTTNDQQAFFTELSYELTHRLTATFGLRYFDYEKTQLFDLTVPLLPALDIKDEHLEKEETGKTLKANLSWKPSENTLIYGQWAEGFRLGDVAKKPLATCEAELIARGISVPDGIDSDSSENFELGIKTTLLDDRIILNASIYHIDWEGIPTSLNLSSCGVVLTLNAGESKSEGVEVEVQSHITESLKLDFSTSYGEAELTEDAESLGAKGDNLPGSADFNLSLGLEYQFSLVGYDSFARVDYAYVSEYHHNFEEIGEASGGYNLINLRTGVSIRNLNMDLFVSNLTNDDSFNWVETAFSGFGSNRAYRLRPRTVGLNLGYQF